MNLMNQDIENIIETKILISLKKNELNTVIEGVEIVLRKSMV
jgi:hypothetical protein